MPSRIVLRLGTRGSPLAIAQSRLVARALRALDPGLDAEPVVIATRGDRDRQTPLSAVADPGFFCEDIDRALLAGEIDCAVHALKDLPLGNRAGIRTAAIPPREDPRDVALFRTDILDLLRTGTPLRIGSSSTRRAVFPRGFLQDALPHLHELPPRLDVVPLRGTVEQRLARLRLARGQDDALDGMVLALAGLARLWGDRDGHAVLGPLLEGLRLMVLPLSRCPTAPGQGALAIECRSTDSTVATRLQGLHDVRSACQAQRELSLLSALAPEARPGFAASCIEHDGLGTLTFTAESSSGVATTRLLWNEPARLGDVRPWDGSDWVRASRYCILPAPDLDEPPALFLAHWHALPPGLRHPAATRVWVSGVESWRRLARRGQWVEGCADNLGFDAIVPTLGCAVLRLPPLHDWTVLTRRDAVASWEGSGVGRVLSTYELEPPGDPDILQRVARGLAAATHCFWGSASQYRALRDSVPAGAHHACGPGKTFHALKAAGLRNLDAFPSRREWQQWLG